MGETLRLRVNNEIPAYRTGLVSALDVGTSKIVCVIGQAEAGSLKVLGSALRESSGLKAGTVTSLEKGGGIYSRLCRRRREHGRCPHPECADRGQLRPAGQRHQPQ